MDTSSIITLCGLGAAGVIGLVGTVWAFGIYVGKLSSEVAQNTGAVNKIAEELAALRQEHDELKDGHNDLKDEVHRRPRARGAS